MTTCSESYTKLEHDFHNSCIISNIFYALTGIYAFCILPGKHKLIGVFIIIIAAVSYIYHSGKTFGVSPHSWEQMDLVFSNIGTLLAFCIVIWKWKELDKNLVLICFVMIAVSTIYFIVAVIAENKYKNVKGSVPDDTSWGGDILGDQNDTQITSFDKERYNILYLSYHTSWHIFSALAVFAGIISLSKLNL